MIFTGWDTPLALLQLELIQRDYEGHRVPKDLKEQVAALEDERDAMNFGAVDPLYSALDELPKDPAFGYVQPNDLEGIRRERPAGPRQLGTVADADLLDRFHAAWTGRAAGCAITLNSSLVPPLNDTIKPKVIGFPEVSMTELAERTLAVHKAVANA